MLNRSVPFDQRIEELFTWLDQDDPADIPRFMNLYFDQPDTAGHNSNPYGAWVSKYMHEHYVNYLNFHPLEVVSRYRDPHLQVSEKITHLAQLIANIDV